MKLRFPVLQMTWDTALSSFNRQTDTSARVFTDVEEISGMLVELVY